MKTLGNSHREIWGEVEGIAEKYCFLVKMLVGDWANVIIWMGKWGVILLCFAVTARVGGVD